jgi:hypothetical protein
MVRYRGYRFEAGGRRQRAEGRRGMYFILLQNVTNCLQYGESKLKLVR